MLLLSFVFLPLVRCVHATSSQCKPPAWANTTHLKELRSRNCARVQQAAKEIPALVAESGESLRHDWARRCSQASSLCGTSLVQSPYTAAETALFAWSTVIMNGSECCNFVDPPFCYSSGWSSNTGSRVTQYMPLIVALASFLALMLSPLCCKRMTAPTLLYCGEPVKLPQAADAAASSAEASRLPGSSVGNANGDSTGSLEAGGLHAESHANATRLRTELNKTFGLPGAAGPGGTALRALPFAGQWGPAVSSLFASMWQTFGFQDDNIRNQFEHLMSLWYSQVAMLGDKAHATQSEERGLAIDDSRFLADALLALHEELMEGFELWRARYRKTLASFGPPEDANTIADFPTVAGEPWPPVGSTQWVAQAKELSEIVAFLLVWGEAGNVRFMPEVLYFITELLLTSDVPATELYSSAGTIGRSGKFLAHIIRPIYNVVFNETVERISVDSPLAEIRWHGSSQALLLSVAEGPGSASGAKQLKLDCGRPDAKQRWAFEHVGYAPDGRRLCRLRCATDSSLCLHVEAISDPGGALVMPTLVLKSVDEGNHSQLFVFDPSSGRVLLSSGASAFTGPLSTLSAVTPTFAASTWCLAAVGNPDALPMRVRLVPLDHNDDHSQRFQVSIVEERSGKDIRQLREGFQHFLPADACNYDDWNELFCDPARLAKSAILVDGGRLFDLPPGRRYAALHRVDWRRTLSGAKTHREIHSWWGAFASSHRVWLLHALVFAGIVCWTSLGAMERKSSDGGIPLAGQYAPVVLAAVGAWVSVHAICWKFVIWAVSGRAIRQKAYQFPFFFAIRVLFSLLLCLLPAMTYVLVRLLETDTDQKLARWGVPQLQGIVTLKSALVLHFAVSGAGAFYLLCFPGRSQDSLWPRSSAQLSKHLARWLFWLVVLAAKVIWAFHVIDVLSEATESLMLCHFTRESADSFLQLAFTVEWDRDLLMYFAVWACAFLLFVTDTQLWFTVGCTAAGVLVGMSQRRWRVCRFAGEDNIAKIPQRFSKKVLWYTSYREREGDALGCSPHFPILWDRIVDHLRYEDKADDDDAGGLRFRPQTGPVDGSQLRARLSAPRGVQPAVPELFRGMPIVERCVRRDAGFLPDQAWPENTELRWRLTALGRALTLELPRPFRTPHIPGMTVLVPHYGESIITTKDELFDGGKGPEQEFTALVTWLERRYPGEFRAFNERMSQLAPEGWLRGGNWCNYTDEQWEKIGIWASMRGQTLWRTVAGMMLYRAALDCHHRVQGMPNCALAQHWSPEDSFTCLVSMQQYVYFNKTQLAHTDQMLRKFERSLKIAYIDHVEKGADGDADGVHPSQSRRYFSCLIDRTCERDDRGRRKPKFKIELPGYPILGDGKGDNQNHAIPFTRGTFLQCIDANQGAYFEQMLLLPCVLGEFRNTTSGSESRGGARGGGWLDSSVVGGRPHVGPASGRSRFSWRGAKKIVGFPELITSDIGSIGDFAASAEFAFGTILQRAYAALGGRMHYGHPDLMAKTYMMQQGGVSKATKTVNLSEDIFAGMDFTLRGAGREIVHREYFHLAKGRDMGFTSVLQFFSKLSAGAGEVLLTRQSFRIGQVLPLPEFLTFYYAHCGFYLSQHLVSFCPRALVFLWLLINCNDSESSFTASSPRTGSVNVAAPRNSQVSAHVLAECFSWVLLLVLIAQALPFIVEVWMQQGILVMLKRYLKQFITLSPLHFIFQSKVIGLYVVSELQNGGAQYIATGRGLPTARRPFLSCTHGKTGLYQDFAGIAFYDGARLLMGAALAIFVGGLDAYVSGYRANLTWWGLALCMTILSWLYTPFIFNPYQFAHQYFLKDLVSIGEFFFRDGGKNWASWFEKTQLKRGTGFRVTALDILYWFILVFAWYATLTVKMNSYLAIFGNRINFMVPFLPPVFCSLVACIVAAAVRGRTRQIPLAVPALACATLGIAETMLSLVPLVLINWWRAVVAALLLKYTLLSMLLAAAQCVLQVTSGNHWRRMQFFLQLWLYGHRMAKDMVVSTFIFGTLSPFVLFDKGRDACFRGCSFHNLLVFRAIGGVERRDQAIRLAGSFAAGDSSARLLSFAVDRSQASHDSMSFATEPGESRRASSGFGGFFGRAVSGGGGASAGEEGGGYTVSRVLPVTTRQASPPVGTVVRPLPPGGSSTITPRGTQRGPGTGHASGAAAPSSPPPQRPLAAKKPPQKTDEEEFEALVTDDVVLALAQGVRGKK